MDEPIDRMLISVRADTGAFARDIATMRAALDGPLAEAAERAGRGVESALARAARTGRLSFDDLRKTALSVLSEIAAAALRSGLEAIFGGTGGGGGAQGGGLLSALGSLLGLPGRATGGPVAPARPYWVGERGPELFVPTSAGQVAPVVAAAPARELRVAITITAPGDAAPQALAQSSRQVARAVRRALAEA